RFSPWWPPSASATSLSRSSSLAVNARAWGAANALLLGPWGGRGPRLGGVGSLPEGWQQDELLRGHPAVVVQVPPRVTQVARAHQRSVHQGLQRRGEFPLLQTVDVERRLESAQLGSGDGLLDGGLLEASARRAGEAPGV